MRIKGFVWFILGFGLIATQAFAAPKTAPIKPPSDFDKRPLLLNAMIEEIERCKSQLRMPEFDPPYFCAFEIKDLDTHHLESRYGAIYQSNSDRSRRLRQEVRVGTYQFDNVGSKAADYDFSFSSGYMTSRYAPLDNDPQALRNSLWLMADEIYKGALKAYLKNKSKKVTEVDNNKDVGSFSKEPAVVYLAPPRSLTFDQDHWSALARTASAVFERHPLVFDSYVTLDGSKITRIFVSSEGTRIIADEVFYNVTIFGATRAKDGMLLTNQHTVYAQMENQLPTDQQLLASVEQLAKELEALHQAPVIDPYTGPAILDGEATGVLFHEVVGHRLEGERQLDEEEGKTFKGQLGNKIIPEFLSVVDDPTLEAINNIALNGHYRFDDEGVAAQKVVLVDHGVLKSFLTSRTPIEGVLHSNGHGRASAGEKPRARMANTIVQSSKTVPFAKLKQMLIDEVQKQGKPYGLVIRNIVGGSTHTSSWGYQAYKGLPQLTYRVFPDGREELVRGVEIVGTPIASINKIVATSDQVSIFNGFCGAESGYVPVSAVAPDVLMTEIELQRTMKKSEKGPILPSPWNHPQ